MKIPETGLQGLTVAAVAVLASATLAAHHSFAMYDQSITYVFTGVVERLNPDGAHMQIAFVPLNDTRDALVRDAEGKPATWLVEMGGSAAMAREGITVAGFARGTVFSVQVDARHTTVQGTVQVAGRCAPSSSCVCGPKSNFCDRRWRAMPRTWSAPPGA